MDAIDERAHALKMAIIVGCQRYSQGHAISTQGRRSIKYIMCCLLPTLICIRDKAIKQFRMLSLKCLLLDRHHSSCRTKIAGALVHPLYLFFGSKGFRYTPKLKCAVTYSEIPLLRPPKIKTFYLLKTLFAKFKIFFSSLSTPSVHLIRDHLWDCSKVVLKTTFGQSQKWS